MSLSEIHTEYVVQFSETDAAGLVHFSNFFRYMERAEWELFRATGLPLIEEQEGVLRGWPRVKAECSYVAPLRFGDALRIHLKIYEITDSSVTYAFRFYKVADKLTLLSRGSMTTVYAEMDRVSGKLRSNPITEQVRALFSISSPFQD